MYYVNKFKQDVFKKMFRIVSWLIGSSLVNYSQYTHLRSGHPFVYPNGTAKCIPSPMTDILHGHGVKVMWGPNIDIQSVLWNHSFAQYKVNYLKTIGKAMRDCNIDGMEIDYEWHAYDPWGIVTSNMSTHYTQFLADIKRVSGKLVSADISIWQYVFGWKPWINVTMLNRGDIDWVNTMSYYWSKSGSLWQYEKDISIIKAWGMDPKRVHIGMPLFSKNKTSEPTWKSLSLSCPNMSIYSNECNGILFVGKNMTKRLSNLVRKEGFGGMFPWAASYDNIKNSIVAYI